MNAKLIVTTGATMDGFGNGDVVDEGKARDLIARMIGVDAIDMVEVLSPDGSRIYCYASREGADADTDNGADAPGWEFVAE